MFSSFSVKKPYTVIVSVVLVIILGVVSLSKMSTDLIPSINLPYAIIVTTYPGASPEEVEASVSKPIEASLAAVSNLESISSRSNENVSMIILEFTQSTSMDSASLEIRESLDLIKGSLPDSAGSPMILKLNPNMLPVMMLAADVSGASRAEVTELVNNVVLPALDSVGGVASAAASGLVSNELNIVLSRKKIDALNDKIIATLDKTLAGKRAELEKAEAEIAAGKNELTAKKTELANGEKLLASTKKELNATLKDLNAQLVTLNEGRPQLESGLTQAKNGLKQLLDGEALLKASEKQLLDAQAAAKANGADLPAAQLAILAQAQAAIAALAPEKETLTAAVAELEATKAQLDAGETQLKAGISQVEDGLAEISSQESVLTSGKAAIKTAETQLKSGETQLSAGRKAFDEAAEKAYEGTSQISGAITVEMLTGIITAQNLAFPAGYIQESGNDVLVRVGDKIKSQDELSNLLLMDLSDFDMQVRVSDVADVIMLDNADNTFTKVNGNEAVIISLQKQTEFSTAEVASAVRERMDKLSQQNSGLTITALMDQGVYVDLVVSSVGSNLLIGAILAILILILFLRDIKLTLVIAVSIPLSLVFALVLMYFSGITLNIISMSGLALGVGMLVDNSIVVIENIYRMRGEGKSAKEAAIYGTKQVTAAITSSTLTTCAVFLPIVFTEGITRQLFTDMALTITYTLVASLVVALTFVPMLTSGALRKTKEKEHRYFEKIKELYGRVMDFSLRRKTVPVLVILALFALSIFGVTVMGTSFFPEMDSPQLQATFIMDDDATFDETCTVLQEAMDIMTGIDDVATVGVTYSNGSSGGGMMSMMMSGGMGGGMGGGNSVSFYILLDDDKKRTNKEIGDEILEKTKELDCEVEIASQSMDISTLTGSGISVEIKGPDLDELKTVAGEIALLVEKTKGTQDVSDGFDIPKRELRITVDKDKSMAKNVTVGEVFQLISSKLSTATAATTLSSGAKSYPVKITSDTDKVPSWDEIKDLTFDNRNGDKIKLSDVAVLSEDNGYASISHDQQQRYVTVSASIADGYNIGLVSRELEESLAAYDVPDGYTVKLTGENESINTAMKDLLMMLLLAIVFVYLIMVAQFQSLKSPFIVLLTLPLAYTGGFIALFVTGFNLSVISVIGFILLTGVVVNNGIVLVDYVNQLRESGMPNHEALILAGKTRLRPIIMTALTTIIAMLSSSFGMGMGAEMVQPMAITVIGGLTYATLLTLIFVPIMYDIFNRKEKKPAEEVSDER